MRRTPIDESTMTPEGVTHASETARPEVPRAGTLIARAAAHDRISAALRKARTRASLSEQQVVDLDAGARRVDHDRRRSSAGSTRAASGSRRPSISPPCTT